MEVPPPYAISHATGNSINQVMYSLSYGKAILADGWTLGELAKAIFVGSRRLSITLEAVLSVLDSRQKIQILILTLLTAQEKCVM